MRVTAIVVAGGLVLACGPSNEELRHKLERRADFDLQCDEVELQPLETTGSNVVSYGAVGCGRQLTYVFSPGTRSWLMQGVAQPSRDATAGAAPSGPVASSTPSSLPEGPRRPPAESGGGDAPAAAGSSAEPASAAIR